MIDQTIYVVVGTVYENDKEETVISQEFVECATNEQAEQQALALEKQLQTFHPDKTVATWINRF